MDGLLKGIVVNNQDPLKMGRIKVRIPHIHGTNASAGYKFMDDDAIDWSYPSFPFYAGYDCGSFVVPPVGCYVWLLPVAGENPYYVYIGSSIGSGASTPKPMNTLYESNPQNLSMGQYFTPTGVPEMPTDLDSDEYGESGVIFKSQKGHTIKYSDKDGAEYFEIIDRSGQSIRFDCPVSVEQNIANQSRRGSSNTYPGGTITITSGGTKFTISNGEVNIKASKITLQSNDATMEI